LGGLFILLLLFRGFESQKCMNKPSQLFLKQLLEAYDSNRIYVLYALKLKLWLRSDSVSKFFLLRN